MANQPMYEVITVPRGQYHPNSDPTTTAFAEKVRALRLRSLQTDPNAFGRTYDEEVQWGLERTYTRLNDPMATQFIAVKKHSPSPSSAHTSTSEILQNLLEDEWLGHVVIVGPQEDDNLNPREFPIDPPQPFPLVSKETGEIIPPKCLYFRIGGTYVDPAGRGLGIGSMLMQATLTKARAEAEKWNAGVRVGLAVFSDNVAAKRTYEKAGFKVVEERPSRSREGLVAVVMENRLVEKG